MRRQPRSQLMQTLAQIGLEMTGHGDDDRRGTGLRQLLDQRELTIRSQGCLDQHDVVRVPSPAAGILVADGGGKDTEPRRRGASPLSEHQVVFDEEQPVGHDARIAAVTGGLAFSRKGHLPLL